MATSTHNKYVSIPDWFSSSSSTPITSAEKPANITNVYYGGGGGGGTTGITEIPIDNKTIVWLDLVITVPIDNDKIIINTEGKITTSGTTGVWELRQLTDGTNYIYTTYPVVTQLGITMYAGTDGLDLGSIYDGLPIDNATIYWDLDENGNKILKAVGSSGGVADSVAWANVTGKPDWLLDGKILYTEIEGIPDLSGFITKDYIDGKFVTFDLNETIDGIKTFTNGIKIGTSLINQSLNDVIYIDANLVVRGGITMYATGTVDIPSILDSLPVAGTESKGIASFDSSYFSVTNGKVTLLTDNVGLNESELAEYLNTNNYAKKSDIPSLNGYATQSWVESKGYALNSDLMSLTTKVDDFLEGSDTDTIINKWLELEAFLSGLSESDNLATILGTKADKTYVDETFVTIGGNTEQVITGAKNFTGGIKINGSPIYYDTEKKYWKLEGDLLVTGGITMYGNEGTYTPSTIMDAIVVDETTISKSGGVLKVIGGTGGGVADSVAWANITGKPTFATVATSGKYSDLSGTPSSLPASDVYSWAKSATKPTYTWSEITSKPTWIGSSKPSYSYSEITGAISTTELQNYLTSNSYLNVTSGDNRYLQLSGGTITGSLEIKCGADNKIVINNTDGEGYSRIVFQENGSYIGQLLSTKDGNIHWGESKIWHSGNDGSGSGLDADTLDGYHVTHFMSYIKGSGYVQANLLNSELWNVAGGDGYIEYYDNGTWFNSRWGKVTAHYGFEGSLSGNASSATKLQTARTIWGQSFDGSGNINGDFYLNSGRIGTYGNIVSANTISIVNWKGKDGTSLGYVGYYADHMIICNTRGGTTEHSIMELYDNGRVVINGDNGGNVGIGTTSPSYKLDVNGTIKFASKTLWGQSFDGTGNVSGNMNGVGIVNSFLNIKQDGSSVSHLFLTNPASNVDYGHIYVSNYDNSRKDRPLALQNGFGNVGIGLPNPSAKLHVSGDILATGGVTMYSMRKLKNVVDERGLSLTELSTIKPTRYTWKDGRDNRLHFGGIADDIKQVLPEVVYSTSDGILTMDYGNAAFAVASSLIQPVVDHEKRIAMLEEENKQLRKEVERLKSA